MGLDKKWIFLYLAVLPLVSGHILQDVMKSIQNQISNGDGLCNVTVTNRKLDRCNVDPANDRVQEGTICSFTSSEGAVETFICDQGYLIYTSHGGTGIDTGHNRNKRFFFLFALFAVALIVCSVLCRSEKKQPEVNHPPTIDCPEDVYHVANKLQVKVKVTWTEPDAKDPENDFKGVEIINDGQPSGSLFGNGTHTIVYRANDNSGNSAECSFVIRIVVIYCSFGPNLHLKNGKALCATPALYGTNCFFSCNSGFQLSHSSPITCEKTGTIGIWTATNELSCQRKQCSSPEPMCKGAYHCTNGNYFESVCYPTCIDGYSTDITMTITCNGETWEGVDDILPCIDIEPPTVTCPPDIHIFVDEARSTVVSWENPTTSDNSESDNCGVGAGNIIRQITGKASGTVFGVGEHLIVYEAADSSQNTQTCQFEVFVKVLSCEPLVVKDQFLLTRCPSGFSVGSTCSFDCFLSYEMVGSPNVTCEKDSIEENKAFWAWHNGSETFCAKLTCPDLPAPAGGALACSSALGNTICTMSCSSDYLIPKGTPIEYVCNDKQIWMQGIPPNCTDRVHPDNAISPGELFYYYSGNCSNETVQDEIKLNFFEVMKNLKDERRWNNICPEYCTVDGVAVTCGPSNGRRRRKRLSIVHRRWSWNHWSTNKITIAFNITSKWQPIKDLWGNEDDMKLLSSYIENKVSNGSFDVPGTSIGNVNFGSIKMSCPTGLEPKYDRDARCEGCSPGKYLRGGDCFECEKGTYQDMEYRTNCTVCPAGKSTEGSGSTRITHCKDKCHSGTYSATGVQPCTPCPLGQYQPEFGKTSCLLCQALTYTSSIGSTNITDCHVMDVAFEKKDSVVMLYPLKGNVNSFTAGLWMKCASSNSTGISISFANLTFTLGNEIIFAVKSKTYSQIVMEIFDTSKWTNIAFSVDGSTKTVKVYGNGVQLATYAVTTATTDEMTVPIGSRPIIRSNEKGCLLSGFYTVRSVLFQSMIKAHANECLSTIPEALYDMDSIYRAEKIGIQIPKTSCDAVDECLSSPCGAGNICINEKEGFSCNCTRGYSGTKCQIPPDFCTNNGCHGDSNCVSHFDKYSCLCPVNFTGALCEHQIVNGNWGSWLQTSECSVTCNGGVKIRERFCNDPEPDVYGEDCNGNNTSIVVCNEQKCPECEPWYTINQYKNDFNCTTYGDSVSCIVTCQPGYSFVKDNFPLDKYICGPETLYKWPANPPPCAPIYSALSLSTSSSVNYQVDCSAGDNFSSKLSSGLTQLQCVGNGTCDVSTSVSGCSDSSRESKFLNTVEVTINLVSDLTSVGDLNLKDFYANNIVSNGMIDMIRIYTDMDKSVNQMNTTDVLDVNDNGILYKADRSSFSFTTNATCPDGKVAEDLMCVDCPTGTYWNAGLCVMCSEGTYQSQSGQLLCIKCPSDFSTRYVGSQKEEDCNVPVNSTDGLKITSEKSKIMNEGDRVIIIIVVLLIAVLVLVSAVAMIFVKKRLDRNKRQKYKIRNARSMHIIGSANKEHPEIVDEPSADMYPRYVSFPCSSTKRQYQQS